MIVNQKIILIYYRKKKRMASISHLDPYLSSSRLIIREWIYQNHQ
ncbi:MAG: hypothetical protein ACJAW1_003489 [Glaciecola sp.]|jgi:hypothetical protein